MRAHLDLVRFFLVPTALADSWAGFFVAGLLVDDLAVSPPALALLALTSASLFLFGMATNDLFDLEKDRRTGAPRPLARGQVKPATALLLALGLAATGLGSATSLGILPLAGATVGTILAYNGGGKRIPVLGNILMGSCRGLNFLLGAALALGPSSESGIPGLDPRLLDPVVLLPALIITAYIASITAISLLEDRPYRRSRLRTLRATLLLFPLLILAWVLVVVSVPPLLAPVAAAPLALYLFRAPTLPPEHSGGPHPAELTVRHGLGGIYPLDAAFLLGAALPLPALGVAVLYALGQLLRPRRPPAPEPPGDSAEPRGE